ncbi:hypothetical protein OPQ81_002850 [Rhizoctonia solani]|nr:hypothetical protein OPQ81_002850 [Rhizoctonia solani]
MYSVVPERSGPEGVDEPLTRYHVLPDIRAKQSYYDVLCTDALHLNIHASGLNRDIRFVDVYLAFLTRFTATVASTLTALRSPLHHRRSPCLCPTSLSIGYTFTFSP